MKELALKTFVGLQVASFDLSRRAAERLERKEGLEVVQVVIITLLALLIFMALYVIAKDRIGLGNAAGAEGCGNDKQVLCRLRQFFDTLTGSF